ncbi:hypothetical protein PAF17_15890 [Paracoccus sp. Z330]|uniref:Uncharacterized protein n=1 Tax=Paracoccus onchidii TaxID=3017813 RepID=A0ABT4ZJ03_9RHOB|nr:hypothetical protein [Paracoccus onchidii]MDB6178973.1 hypothetical protein [Paracoccus onchidii]
MSLQQLLIDLNNAAYRAARAAVKANDENAEALAKIARQVDAIIDGVPQ